MTMVLCGWIVLILQVQSVFNCKPSDPCCPDDDECCADGFHGCCLAASSKIPSGTYKNWKPEGFRGGECFCSPYGSPASVITPFVKANFGNWGEWQHCPKGGYVVGMRMKKESWQGIECQ